MTYLQARTHYGVVDPAALTRARADLGAGARRAPTSRALDALYARVIWIPDGEIEPLTDAAMRYREIEDADPAPTSRRASSPTRAAVPGTPVKGTMTETPTPEAMPRDGPTSAR